MKFTNYLKEEKENNKKEIYQKIVDFLTENPNPSDKEFHKFAEDMGIDEHKMEEYVYSMIGSIFGNGKAMEKGITEKDVDKKELEMGVKVEKEHTGNELIAKKVALDHLAELPDYYTRLKKMEGEE